MKKNKNMFKLYEFSSYRQIRKKSNIAKYRTGLQNGSF